MMYQLNASQIKAARAYLDWSQEDLANETGLALNTIRNLEMGFISPREKTVNTIRQVMERAGLEFIEPAGIRLRTDEIRVFEGPDSCETLLDDMIQTVKKADREIAVLAKSQEMLAKSFGVSDVKKIDRLEKLISAATVRCLLFETKELPFPIPQFQFRAAPMEDISPTPYFVYGSKHALVLPEGGSRFRFVVFTLPMLAHSYRSHFHAVWAKAKPFSEQRQTQ